MKPSYFHWRLAVLNLLRIVTTSSLLLASLGVTPVGAAAPIPINTSVEEGGETPGEFQSVSLAPPGISEQRAGEASQPEGDGGSAREPDRPGSAERAAVSVSPGERLAGLTPPHLEELREQKTGGAPQTQEDPTYPLNTPAALEASQVVSLTLRSDFGVIVIAAPAAVQPGEEIVLTWESDFDPKAGVLVELSILAPQGFQWVGEGGSLEAERGLLRLPIEAKGGEAHWRVDESAIGPFSLRVGLIVAGAQVAEGEISLEEAGLVFLEKGSRTAEGGSGGQIRVTFPEGAISEEGLAVKIRRPVGEAFPPETLSGDPFEIQAVDPSTRAELAQFGEPLLIEYHYDETTLRGAESALEMSYYDEGRKAWQPVSTIVDTENNVLRAWTDHLTVFDISFADWEASRLPSLQPFQVAEFTGAATYSLDLWTPPGPGGLQPSLALSYNSQEVDNATGRRSQASWVGMGWSLETGYIERNMHGTTGGTGDAGAGDDTFSLVVGGMSSMLLRGADGYYHTVDESFWRIKYEESSESWTVWDKSGTKYLFGSDSSHRAIYPARYQCDAQGYGFYVVKTWRWALKEIQNVHGKKLTFNYFIDTAHQKTHTCLRPNGKTRDSYFDTQVWIYPATISYPNGQYSIEFVREARLDYQDNWEDDKQIFQRHRLKEMLVKNSGQTVRRYRFGYATGGDIHPGAQWGMGGYTLALTSLTEFGKDGSSLPATTFTYDGLHLTRAQNGYGGKVEFTYDNQVYFNGPASNHLFYERTTTPRKTVDKPGCFQSGALGKWKPNVDGPDVSCTDDGLLKVNGVARMAVPVGLFQPGAVYRVSTEVSPNTPGANIRGEIGIDGAGVILANSIQSTGTIDLDGYVTLPANGGTVVFYMRCSTKCIVRDYLKFELMTTRYRVREKKIYDGVSPSPQVFTQQYDEPATNDTLHSLAADEEHPYFEATTEFRGHAVSRTKGPDGTSVWSIFSQDDPRKGRQETRLVMEESFYDDFENGVSGSSWANCNTINCYSEQKRGDKALKITSTPATYVVRAADSLSHGETALVQFMASGSTINESWAFVEQGVMGQANYRRFGVHARPDGSLWAQYSEGTSHVDAAQLWDSANFKRDRWYVLQIGLDEANTFFLRVWERGDPWKMKGYRRAMSGVPEWRFKAWTKDGTLYLDTYSEGKLLSVEENRIVYSTQPLGVLPDGQYGAYDELRIYWTRVTDEKKLSFEGSTAQRGSKTTYQYTSSYGNVEYRLEASLNTALGNWYDYRISRSGFYPTVDSNRYIVGLPGYLNTYFCNPGSMDGACLASPLTPEQVTASTWYLYDGSILYTTPPTSGVLTGKRVMTKMNACEKNCYQDEIYGYDAWGNRTSETRYADEGSWYALGTVPRTIGLVYDSLYHTYLITETNALNQSVGYAYDFDLGLPITRRGPNPATVVQARYDVFGRLVKVAQPEDDIDSAPTLQVTYQDTTAPFPIELRQRIEGEQYAVFRRYYNGLGQELQRQTLGALLEGGVRDLLVDCAYDAYGRPVKQSVPYEVTTGTGYRTPDPSAAAVHTAYDGLGRPRVITATDEVETVYSYGVLSTTVQDELGHETTTLSDEWGRVVQVIPELGPEVAYTYDTRDRLTLVSRGGATTTLQYDFHDRKTGMSDPDMGSWSYAYDALDLRAQTDARGCITSLAYDLLDRLTSKTYSGSCEATTGVSFAYDQGTNGVGLRTGMTDASGLTSWAYDASGRMTGETRAITGVGSFATNWGYNSAGLLNRIQYPADDLGALGEQVDYSYLPQLSLSEVTSTISGTLATQAYEAAGRLVERILGGQGLATQYVYNPWTAQGGRLQSLNSGTSADPDGLQSLVYTYDLMGNILSVADAVNGGPQTQTFTYDALYRLASAQASGGSQGDYALQSYTYDPTTGNLASKAGVSYTYGDPGHAHAVTALSNGSTYAYDANGNLIQRVVDGQTYNLSYDGENRLAEVSGAASASFVYDGDGQRVLATVGGETTVFIGNYFEWEVGTGESRKYYYAGATRIAMWTEAGGLQFILGDHLGSTSVIADTSGTLLSSQGYMPWGETRYGSVSTEYQYTGQYRQQTIGLDYYNARWYDPSLAQFTQPDVIIPDPYNSLDWNRYSYARSNPLKYTDPNGHFPWLVVIGILIYMATIPGDTGPYEVDPTTAAVGDAGLRMADPVDLAYTGIECLSGNCSGTDIALGLLPFVNGAMDDAIDAARALDSSDVLAHADDVVETAGQFHHIFSSKISNALDEHRTLSGAFDRGDFIVQGLDTASHNGYQTWHRAYDDEVVEWLETNREATPAQFLAFMKDLYKRTDMRNQFPDAYKLLEMAEEELQ